MATTAELCVGRHDLSFLATNSAGMTTERTRSLRVLPLLPAARSMLSFSKYMDVIYDLADVDGAAYPGGFKWGGWNLPVLKVTTSTVGLESVIRGHPTTILVNGEPQPFTHDGEYARFSVASIPLLTGTNVLTMTCSRDSDVFITTEAVVYNDGVTNHPPSISNPSGTHPYAWGTWFRVDLDGHDFNWDYCSRTVQMSYKPLEVATEGDWLDAPVFQAIDCDVMRRVCPPAWFGWPGQLTYNIVKPGWDWPGYPGGGWGWQQRHEGPIWLRMRAFDGKAQSDWTTAAQPMDYDPAQPRGMTNFRVVANETGSLTVSWDAAQDANFDTYFISAEFTNRFVFPPLQSYHLIGGREGDLGGYGTWRQIDYWMSRITYRATMAVDSTFTTSSTTQCTITTLPAGVEIELRLWARDTHGNLSSPVMLTTWTASDFVHAEPVTDFINPAPNPYAHRLGTTCSVRYTLAATLPILVNVYHHDTQALVRSWATTGVAGENEIVWDGKDHLGLRVDEGEYAIRLETTQPNRTKSISDSYFIRVQY
ncbi:MAG: hypothetical protein HY816_11435 [Candidatus Wallbacteria bacterium]|nr:hypothetical protein [Candidatus Wallbacteria bacterium]